MEALVQGKEESDCNNGRCANCDKIVMENEALRFKYNLLLKITGKRLRVKDSNYASLYGANIKLENEILQLDALQRSLFRQLRATQASLKEAQVRSQVGSSYEILTEEEDDSQL